MNGPLPAAYTEAANLSQVEDDFSIKLTLDDDPHFWWRVEKTDDDVMLITDFMQGKQPDYVMARALAGLVVQRKGAQPLELVFHDLIPGNADPAAQRIALNRTGDSIQRWSSAAALMLGLQVDGSEFRSRRDKFQMIIILN